jgi:glyceraldehyde 3-phosphate dehydrogenase
LAGKVAINGLGRIGRAALKLAVEQPDLELVAVNEIGSLDNMVYLLNYDTVYGRYERQVDAVDGKLVIDGKPLVYLSERDPEQLPWAELELAAPAPVLDDHRGREYGAAHGPCAPQRTHREASPAPAGGGDVARARECAQRPQARTLS